MIVRSHSNIRKKRGKRKMKKKPCEARRSGPSAGAQRRREGTLARFLRPRLVYGLSVYITNDNIPQVQSCDAFLDFGKVSDNNCRHCRSVKVFLRDAVNRIQRHSVDILEIIL